ncbi:MAG: hypothetical protein ABIY38_05545, partial [Rhodococcus sp. (in: high G+C Gram-positive bacteria)]
VDVRRGVHPVQAEKLAAAMKSGYALGTSVACRSLITLTGAASPTTGGPSMRTPSVGSVDFCPWALREGLIVRKLDTETTGDPVVSSK